MELVIQVLVILIVLFNFFVLFMCARTWKIFHIICAFFLLAAAITFLVYATMALKTRLAWVEVHDNLVKEVEKNKAKEIKIDVGDPAEANATELSLRSAKVELKAVLLDRGRVWPSCTPQNAAANSITLSTAPPGAVPTDVRPNRIDVNLILYAFRDGPDTQGIWQVPKDYLGEFRVTAAADTTVSMSPTLPLDAEQLRLINAGGSTWTLYEVMPIDGHEQFALQGTDPDEDHIFGTMDKPELSKLLPQARFSIPANQYSQLIDAYSYDGMPLEEIRKTLPNFDPPPEEIWVRVKFKVPHSVDVDGPAGAALLTSETFDPSGRALAPSLRQGQATDFEPGSFGVFDQDTANQLVRDGKCETVKQIYVRPLHDYAHHFQEIQRRLKMIQEAAVIVQADTKTLDDAKKRLDVQITLRTAERDNLQADLANFTLERDEITRYRARLEQQLAGARGTLSQLYRANVALADELAMLQKQMADEINRRTAEATAKAP
jgi:DNA-binding transcriptional MerR regulator